MSLVKKYVLSTFNYKNISACSYLFKDNWVNCAQYYTCSNNAANVQSRVFKYKRVEDDSRRVMSVKQTMRETNFSLRTKIKNFSENVAMFLPFLGRKYRRLGYLWFTTLDELQIEDFFTLLEIPDTFYSRFQIIELHVWMLLYHLPSDGRINLSIRVGVVEAMWEDSERRAKLLQEYNLNLRKNFRDLYGEFLFAEFFYDYCFNKSDTALSSAVWCSFFNKENVDPRLIEALVYYIRFQMHHLDKINFRELSMKEEKPRIWAPARPRLEEILKKS